MSADGRPTLLRSSLGPSIELHGSVWSLDLTGLPIFKGLSVLALALGEQVIEQTHTDRVDITVERPVHPRENPELLHVLGVTRIKVSAEHEIIASISKHPEVFQDHLRALLGTLQRKSYREALFPAERRLPSSALVFNLSFPDASGHAECRFVVERIPSKVDEQCYLRICVENPIGRRLDLASVPHLVVEDLESRSFIAGSTRIAQTWREALVREAERGRHSFVETRTPYNHTFAQLAKAGLGKIESISLNWNDAFLSLILESSPTELERALKTALLALEDRVVRDLLMDGDVVRILVGEVAVYLDQSQLGRVLNVGLGSRRERVVIDQFLDRMSKTSALVESTDAAPLSGIKIFLIHHVTAEVLGLVAALRRLGCRDLVTLFVAYAGETPRNFLDALLNLPPNEFRCVALTHVPDEDSVEGHYKLSSQYSPLSGCDEVVDALKAHVPYVEAMQTVAVSEFMRLVARAEAQGQRCLIIEDGGYLAPLLNRMCLEGRSVKDLVGAVSRDCNDHRPLDAVLRNVMIGSVEHTRAGFDQLEQVEQRFGSLAFPAFSIAISHLKSEVESEEVAVSILNACENVLHATGRILSRRHCLVLGSRGAIGRSLMKALRGRLREPATQLSGVDVKIEQPAAAGEREVALYRDLPTNTRSAVDLVLGVTGRSVLEGADVERWLIETSASELILASGSTKTVEFSGVAKWLDALLSDPTPRILEHPVSIAIEDVEDPQTSRVFGQRYRLMVQHGTSVNGLQRSILFLANLTPVNFLFYGVPTEMIDEVIAQLVRCSIGLVRRSGQPVSPRLYAVDRDIDADGERLAAGRTVLAV